MSCNNVKGERRENIIDMPSAFNNLTISDYMDPYKLAQLADDTIIIADHTDHFKEKFIAL